MRAGFAREGLDAFQDAQRRLREADEISSVQSLGMAQSPRRTTHTPPPAPRGGFAAHPRRRKGHTREHKSHDPLVEMMARTERRVYPTQVAPALPSGEPKRDMFGDLIVEENDPDALLTSTPREAPPAQDMSIPAPVSEESPPSPPVLGFLYCWLGMQAMVAGALEILNVLTDWGYFYEVDKALGDDAIRHASLSFCIVASVLQVSFLPALVAYVSSVKCREERYERVRAYYDVASLCKVFCCCRPGRGDHLRDTDERQARRMWRSLLYLLLEDAPQLAIQIAFMERVDRFPTNFFMLSSFIFTVVFFSYRLISFLAPGIWNAAIILFLDFFFCKVRKARPTGKDAALATINRPPLKKLKRKFREGGVDASASSTSDAEQPKTKTPSRGLAEGHRPTAYWRDCEYDEVVDYAEARPAAQEMWFLVDASWVVRWKHYLLEDGPPPGPVTNNRLLRGTDPNRPKRFLRCVTHYRGVVESVYTAMIKYHGGGPTITRPYLDIYDIDGSIHRRKEEKKKKKKKGKKGKKGTESKQGEEESETTQQGTEARVSARTSEHA